MRAVAIAAALLAAWPALGGGRGASLRVSAQVVSSARLMASASAAVLVQQRSGAPMRLADGTPLPREGQQPLVVPAAAGRQRARAPASGGAVILVTLFPDGAPPARN